MHILVLICVSSAHVHIIDYNILLRKTCEHKNTFICDCDSPPFNVLIGDFDYCHQVDTDVKSPERKGTKIFQALSVRINVASNRLFAIILTTYI